MFQSGDIVEHTRGRWKGRRMQVVSDEPNGCLLVRTKSGYHNIIKTDDIKVIRCPLLTDWIRILHRIGETDKIVLQRAFAMRLVLKQEEGRSGIRLQGLEKFLWTFFNLCTNPE